MWTTLRRITRQGDNERMEWRGVPADFRKHVHIDWEVRRTWKTKTINRDTEEEFMEFRRKDTHSQ